MDYRILLYYNFTRVDDPEAIREEQENFCREHNLKGRILIAHEGINGTVSGLKADTDAYMRFMQEHPVFSATEFKIDEFDRHAFLKLHVRVKDEIVHFGLGDLQVDAMEEKNYIEPEEFRKVLQEDADDVVILDARSNYETSVGKFRNAIAFDIENFRELPEKLQQMEELKDKQIITYCTGGIKCEKVTAYMRKLGFENVRQLHGGIVRYAHETGGEGFEGSCYVFDQRVVVPVNQIDPVVIGKCHICGSHTEKMVNCANADCNRHDLVCENCLGTFEGCCSEACMESPKRRSFDGRGYYLRGVNSKNYIQS